MKRARPCSTALRACPSRSNLPIQKSTGPAISCSSLIELTAYFVTPVVFDVLAIDIYTFKGQRLARKDTYWKIIRE